MRSLLTPVPKLLRQVSVHALDLIFPPRCARCAVDLDSGTLHSDFCSDCLRSFRLVNEPTCARCAARLPAAQGAVLDCPHCERQSFRFDTVTSLGWYEGALRDLVLRMKRDTSGVIARALADASINRLHNQLSRLDIDFAAPAPIQRIRQWSRGTHPAGLLAAALARSFPWRCEGRLLRRRGNAPPQAGLSRVGRLQNVRGKITVTRGRLLKGASVLLIDDVLTTGATSSETARVLKQAGAARVHVFVVARADGSL